jgi:adenosylcobinamide-GDP ribazoletransferase
MHHQLRLFFTALEYLTRLRKPRWVGFDAAWLPQSMSYLPVVGMVVGLGSALAFWVFAQLLPGNLAVLAAIVVGLLMTGALHEDGLADTCDALGAGGSQERMLAIMQDSRLGTYGVLGLVAMLLARFLSLDWLPAPWVMFALVVAHTWSRIGPLALMASLAHVRRTGPSKARAATTDVGWRAVVIGIAWGLLLLLACLAILMFAGHPWWIVAPLCAGAGLGLLASVLAGIWAAQHLGGYTGDTLGAAQQCGELVCYLTMVAIARNWSGA